MREFYHLTKRKNVENILKEGLKPGIEFGIQTAHFGVNMDNKYIYLLKNIKKINDPWEECGNDIDEKITHIKVIVPENHPIERDLDVWAFIEGEIKSQNPFRFLNALWWLKDLGVKAVNNNLVISKENILGHIEKMSDEEWDTACGYYRTQLPIPSNKEGYKIIRLYY